MKYFVSEMYVPALTISDLRAFYVFINCRLSILLVIFIFGCIHPLFTCKMSFNQWRNGGARDPY